MNHIPDPLSDRDLPANGQETGALQEAGDDPEPEMFSSEWYDEYFRHALSSGAHARFCERV
jgi:hypothetical protein